MKQYHELLQHVLDKGVVKTDRTGVGTKSVFGYQVRFDLSKGLPLLTTKKLHLKSIIHELLWFIKGDTNIKYLKENGVTIWDEWADENGDLGPVYGKQWRAWEGKDGKVIDQLKNVIEQIKTNPNSRRLIVSAWNVSEVEKMKLPPCHCFFQFYVANNKLSCHLLIRSNDLFLGNPYNVAQYSILTHMIAQVCGLDVGEFILTIGDAHIYLNHMDQVKLQLSRTPFSLPTLELNKAVTDIDGFKFDDFKVLDYQAHPSIKAPVAI